MSTYAVYCPTTGETVEVGTWDEAVAEVRRLQEQTGAAWHACYSAPQKREEKRCTR